ncbi:hypothetical protein BJX62DRAFT_243885 [Aspergillus germanicus]
MDDISLKLLQDVRALHSYLDSAGLPHPSFDKNTPPVVLPNDAPLEVQNAREQIMDAALRLFRLAAGPSDHISHARTAYEDVATLQWLWHFQNLRLTNVAVTHAKSIIRMAIITGLFEEPTPQQISHSATSLYIRSNEPNRTWAAWICDIYVPAAAAMAAVHTKWPRSLSRTHTSYSFANDTELPFFEHLAQLPERKARLQGLIKTVSSLQKHNLKHTIAGFDWASLGEATVVDVGGSTGHVSIALAHLPEVIENAPFHLASLSDSTALASRITYLTHSFLTPQPTQGAAVYFLRMILHDWPTDDAINILSHLVPALGKNSRIIVMDSLLPDLGSVPLTKERLLRVQDLTMLQNFNDGERVLEDWRQMFARVEGACLLIALIAYIVRFVVNRETALPADSLEYALYKNTRFPECYQNLTITAETTCADVEVALRANIVQDGITIMTEPQLQVIPSIPRDSAFRPTLLRLWTQTAVLYLGALYQFSLRLHAAYRSQSSRCKGLRKLNPLTWLIHAYDLVSWAWWWITFAIFAAAPDRASLPFVLGWMTPWKYHGLIKYHPYSCIFHRHPQRVKVARWALYLLTIGQWGATIYTLTQTLLSRSHPTISGYGMRAPNPSYDCDRARVLSGPGTTSCSANQLCNNRTSLYVDAPFGGTTSIANACVITVMSALSALAGMPLLTSVSQIFVDRPHNPFRASRRELARRLREGFNFFDLGTDTWFAITSVLIIIIGGLAFGETINVYREPADAAFNVDWMCHAVHVSLSQWRFYLDVEAGRPLRLAQMWFGA